MSKTQVDTRYWQTENFSRVCNVVDEEPFSGALSGRNLALPPSESPKGRYQRAVYVIGTHASEVSEPIASTRESDFSKTFESRSLIIGEGILGKESMSRQSFEWHQAVVTSIPVVILPERINGLYVEFLAAIRSIGQISWRVMERIKARTKTRETTEIAFGFEGIVSIECIEFCNSHGLTSILRQCLNQAKEIFSNIDTLSAEYKSFDEEDGEAEGHVAITVRVNSNRHTAMSNYDRWIDWKVDTLDAQARKYFTLTFHRSQR
jgi:hypothetical protein